MRYKAHKKYKPSDLQWLTEVPEHWEVRRLKFTAAEPLQYGANEAAELTDPDLPRYIRITDVRDDGNLHEDTFRSLPLEVAEPYLLEDGDILLARSGATVGKSFQYLSSWGPSAYAGYLIRYRVDQQVLLPRFAYYFLRSRYYWSCIESRLIQATIQNFSAEKYACINIPAPPIEEQKQIADFLDWKTGEIDTLIVRKKQLIEKLKEQRTAVITQAVTRGIDANVPLRDSGVAWLGEVPDHWEVKRLRFICAKIEQGWSPQCDNQPADADSWGVMKVGCVNGDYFDPQENKTLPMELEPKEQYELRPKDILISRANTKELLGSAAIVPDNVRPKLLLCDKLYRLRVEHVVDEEFLTLYLRTPIARYQYERDATGASGSMQNIGQDTIRNVIVALPPIEEQKLISKNIENEVARIDSLTQRASSVITHLKEYRAALITSAVTGKIDVRETVPLH